jgi:glycosyltransferase involved in cell wall biosynthesis
LHWFCRFGWDVINTTPLDLLRVLFEEDAKPDRGLVASYLVQPAWQEKHPDALTPGGWAPFKRWLAQEYGIRGHWLRRAELAPQYWQPSPPADLAVNAIGLFRYTSGLQQAALSVVQSLKTAGVRLSLRDVPRLHNRDGRPRTGFDGLELYPITIINTGLDIPVAEAYRLAGLHPQADVYRIAIWWWELEQLPREWLDRGRDVDEIWAPTAFIANALRPLGKPVRVMLPSGRLPEFQPLPKQHFGLWPDKFTFLFVFDMNSRMPRKNPIGLMRAFRRAFRPSEPVELAIKVSPQEEYYGDWWRELRAAARDYEVSLIDRSLGRGDLLALMNATDAYVSLHRSEGFGLTMAEAMLLGKPTIATGYSGNLDFMTAENSSLVQYERTAIAEDVPPYPKGFVWAEPSEEHAAELMRRVYDRRDEAAKIAERGRRSAAALLSPEAAASRMMARLREILET